MSLSSFGQFIHYGLTGTVSTSNYSFKSGSNYSKKLKYPLNYGASGGLFIRYSPSLEQASRTIRIRPILQLEAKVAQHYMVTNGFPTQSSLENYTDVITRAEIPLMIGVEYKGVYQFLIGPSLNTNMAISSTTNYKDGTKRSYSNMIRYYKRFGVGLNVSASYSYKFLIFSVQYERSLSDVKVQAFSEYFRLKMNTIRLGVAISLFNKNNEKNKNSIYWK
jgi:hypothetical protein